MHPKLFLVAGVFMLGKRLDFSILGCVNLGCMVCFTCYIFG